MSKLTDVTIINDHTIRLNTDAYKGDEINLLDINNVDLNLIKQKIDDKRDLEYNRRLEQLQREMNLIKDKEIQEALRKSNEEVIKLKQELELSKSSIKTEIESRYNLKIEQLNNQITSLNKDLDNLKNNKANEIDLAVKNKESEVKDKIYELTTKLNNLESEKKQLVENFDLQKQLSLKDQEDVYQERIKELDDQLNKLKNEKASLNVKTLGERLEKWVEQEYHNHALNGYEKSVFHKDNDIVKGTKADFIYKVYASEEKLDEDLLTSVAIEVKSESPETVNKKKNSDHYQKLDSDRQKKNCEYALLVSELEWDVLNDAPIRRVNEYDKMYLVRPPYFMVFIQILTALSLKYKDVLTEYNLEMAKFEDSNKILEDFEEMKSAILERSLKYINDHVKEIEENASEIIKRGQKILDSTKIILDTHISTVINKIESFNIKKIVKEIEKLED